MEERTAHLVDEVLPSVAVRQWVLSLPPRVRYLLAWDHDLCRTPSRTTRSRFPATPPVVMLPRSPPVDLGIPDAEGGDVTVPEVRAPAGPRTTSSR
jgi:hypothetical protein